MIKKDYLNTALKNLEALDLLIDNINDSNIMSIATLICDSLGALLKCALIDYDTIGQFEELLNSNRLSAIYDAIPKFNNNQSKICKTQVKIIERLSSKAVRGNKDLMNTNFVKDCYEILYITLAYLLMYVYDSYSVSIILEDNTIGNKLEEWSKHNIDTIRSIYNNALNDNVYNNLLVESGILTVGYDTLEYKFKTQIAEEMRKENMLC